MAKENVKVKGKIGFDLDGVLVDHGKNKKRIAKDLGLSANDTQVKDLIYGKISLNADVMRGAKRAIAELSKNFDLFIISRRQPRSRPYGRKWLKKYFCFPPKNIFFVDKDEDKFGVLKKLGIDFFIDDKKSVLKMIKQPVKKFLFEEKRGFDELLKNSKKLT